jgi:hypothetical protein
MTHPAPSSLKGEGGSPPASGARGVGLSAQTAQLWLAATRARRRADEIAQKTAQ